MRHKKPLWAKGDELYYVSKLGYIEVEVDGFCPARRIIRRMFPRAKLKTWVRDVTTVGRYVVHDGRGNHYAPPEGNLVPRKLDSGAPEVKGRTVKGVPLEDIIRALDKPYCWDPKALALRYGISETDIGKAVRSAIGAPRYLILMAQNREARLSAEPQ